MPQTCDICHRQPVRIRLCEIINGVKQNLHLCGECFRSRSAAAGMDFPVLDGTQVCCYCGAPAQCGGMNQREELLVRKVKRHFTCFRCAQLYYRFFGEALEAVPKDFDRDQQIEAITQVIAETDRRIREHLPNTES